MAPVYIGADVDCKMTELAFEIRPGEVMRQRVPTTVRALRQALGEVGGTKKLTFEEGPMAQWLYRNLKADVDELTVCDPRRNRLISDDGDKADPIDAAKLAELYRGRFLRRVYHSDDEQRVLLKEWVSLYYDRVTDAVRQVNKIRARCRMHGIRPARGAMRNEATWLAWLDSLGDHPVAAQLRLLAVGLQAVRAQVKEARRVMEDLAAAYPVVTAWKALPGVGPVRAITLLAYLDTPYRFASAKKLWKYCGVGLQRSTSGTGKDGRPRAGKLRLAYRVNRRLKAAMLGAAWSAIGQGDNVFAWKFQQLVDGGLYANNAWHTVARKMLTVMWGMWKTASRFNVALAGDGAACRG